MPAGVLLDQIAESAADPDDIDAPADIPHHVVGRGGDAEGADARWRVSYAAIRAFRARKAVDNLCRSGARGCSHRLACEVIIERRLAGRPDKRPSR